MELLFGINIVDLGLQIGNNLILADLHIGYEEALNKQGVFIPRFHFKDLTKRIESMLQKVKPEIIIINGDLKHEFGTISATEWNQTLDLLELLSKHSNKIILIQGNHDTILQPIANKKNLEIVDYYMINNIYICHGHKIPEDLDFKNSKTVIIGHEHPAVSLSNGVRSEKFKCFLKGRYDGKDLIIMPSLNPVTEGTDVLKENLLSPFLKKNKHKLETFNVYVVGDKVYNFGKLKKLKRKSRTTGEYTSGM